MPSLCPMWLLVSYPPLEYVVSFLQGTSWQCLLSQDATRTQWASSRTAWNSAQEHQSPLLSPLSIFKSAFILLVYYCCSSMISVALIKTLTESNLEEERADFKQITLCGHNIRLGKLGERLEQKPIRNSACRFPSIQISFLWSLGLLPRVVLPTVDWAS